MTIETLLGWALTYLIHSTILVLGVWLTCRGIKPLARRVGPRGENLGWKLALVGGLVTATVQISAGVTPALGALALDAGPGVVESSAAAQAGRLGIAPSARTPALRGPHPAPDAIIVGGRATLAPLAPLPSEAAEVVERPRPAPLWPKLLLGVWILGATVALLRLLGGVRALKRRLKDRSEVLEDPVLETFLTLCRDAEINRKIRLTQSTRIASPVALWRREIVLPAKAVAELSPAAMRSVLAHELAHLERRDPHWLALAAVIEALLFFQPLNRLARRGMQESAELLCDDWAIARTGDGVGFAKSLAEIASWHDANRSSVLVAGMISGEGPLVRRVRRALDGDPRRFESEDGSRSGQILLGLGTLLALVLVAPGAVSAGPPEGEQATADEPRDKARAKRERKARKQAEKARKQAEKARKQAEKAERRAAEARAKAEQAERQAAEAARRAELDRDPHSGSHLIIRDGDEILSIDGRGILLRAPEGEVVIDHEGRMRVRVREGDFDFDLDFDLDELEDLADMAEQMAGELIQPNQLRSRHRQWQIAPGFDPRELEEMAEELEHEFELRFDSEDFEREMEELERQLRREAEELRRQFEPPQPPPPPAPTPAPTEPTTLI